MFHCSTISVPLFHHQMFDASSLFNCATTIVRCDVLMFHHFCSTLPPPAVPSSDVLLSNHKIFYCSTITCSTVPSWLFHCCTIRCSLFHHDCSPVPPIDIALFHHDCSTVPPSNSPLFHHLCSIVPPSDVPLFHHDCFTVPISDVLLFHL